MLSVSIVVPIFDERCNIRPLYEELHASLSALGRECEMIFVDDGSVDDSDLELIRLADADKRVKVIQFRRNYGQSAAMQAGIQAAVNDVVVTLDGDLQNDPADIGLLLEKIDEGYDLVHGWRKERKDAFWNRRLPSQVANRIISRATRFPVHDLGCTLKAIRREIAQELELCGEMHRFIPILANWRGAKCVEVVTNHRARQFGKTKYGLDRTFRVLFDLATVLYMLNFLASPMKFFGTLGLGCTAVSIFSGSATIAMRLFGDADMTGNPLLLLTTFSAMLAVQFISLGLIGEVCSRIYFGTQGNQHFAVRETWNLSETGDNATSVSDQAWSVFPEESLVSTSHRAA